MPAQGMIRPGGQDPARCAASVAYNCDLFTGGGQYCQIDWRLFPEKFPYGAGVTNTEYHYGAIAPSPLGRLLAAGVVE